MDIPLPRRLPNDAEAHSSIGKLINDFEAEEERIVNLLSRKLEQLQEEKIQLANTLEAENESLVNRLTRQLVALRQQQIQQQQQAHVQNYAHPGGLSNAYDADSASSSPVQSYAPVLDPHNPSADLTINALRRENEMLRNRLVDTEREFVRMVRLNDVYREELIELRRRLGIPTDTLLVADTDPLRQPIHRRRESSSSPVAPTHPLPVNGRLSARPLPIPRPPSQIHRPQQPVPITSAVTTSSNSPNSSLPPSPFPFSPNSAIASPITTLTTPASIPQLTAIPPQSLPSINQLTYPHVPPPSLSSSLGSPVAMFSPASGLPSRRNSVRVAESGSLMRSRRNTSASASAEVHHIGRGRAESSSGFTVFGIDEVDAPEEGTQNP